MIEKWLSLVITDEIYLQSDPDISTAIVLLFPYEEEECLQGCTGFDFENKPCTSLHIRLKQDFPNEVQQEYLRHLLKRGLILDVRLDSESISERILG